MIHIISSAAPHLCNGGVDTQHFYDPRYTDVAAVVADYYADPCVRERMQQFLEYHGKVSALFVSHRGEGREDFESLPVAELWNAVTVSDEFHRSLWDSEGLLAHLDIEYVHFDDPWAAFDDPERSFALQAPVIAQLDALLQAHGITPLRLLTGRGYHYLWRIQEHSPVFEALREIGQVHPALEQYYRFSLHPWTEALYRQVRAFAGLALVMEYVGGCLLQTAGEHCKVPLRFTAVLPEAGERGREAVSLDLSEYGDPLNRRLIRLPYTLCWKAARLQGYTSSPHPLPWLVTVPLATDEVVLGFESRDPAQALIRARHVPCDIPDMSEGSWRLFQSYRDSPLARFHEGYYACAPHGPNEWEQTYDRLPSRDMPACLAQLLTQPCDALLTPAGLQHLTRGLLGMGWHPRHITGVVWSRLSRDYGWKGALHFHEPFSRAEFYTRAFAGLVFTGRDRLWDFDCAAVQGKGYCPETSCRATLAPLRCDLQRRVDEVSSLRS